MAFVGTLLMECTACENNKMYTWIGLGVSFDVMAHTLFISLAQK